MRTKYNISSLNVYIGPIGRRRPVSLYQPRRITRFPGPTSPETDYLARNNNTKSAQVEGPGYVATYSSRYGGHLYLDPGHMKHTFSTSQRSGTVHVLRGEVKVKSGTDKWKLTTKTLEFRLNTNTVYYVKNNSLHNSCLLEYHFDGEDADDEEVVEGCDFESDVDSAKE